MKKMSCFVAFTLAEVLVTLTIIGLVAALSFPALKHHADEQKYIALTKKAYKEITEATMRLEQSQGDIRFWDFTNEDSITDKYKSVMNVMPVSSDSSANNWRRHNLSGENDAFYEPKFFTADGMAWRIFDAGYSCGGAAALVDVNGKEEPNTVGIDMHGFRIGTLCDGKNSIGEYGIYAMGDYTHDQNSAWACTAYAIHYGKMPWLYTPTTACNDYMLNK